MPPKQPAKDKGYDVKTAQFPFSANGKAMGLGDAVGFVKVVADATHNEILGAHLIGPDVTELLPILTLCPGSRTRRSLSIGRRFRCVSPLRRR